MQNEVRSLKDTVLCLLFKMTKLPAGRSSIEHLNPLSDCEGFVQIVVPEVMGHEPCQ